MYILSITLSDGKQYTFRLKHRHAYWKSWLMQQLPYGTDFLGAEFSIERQPTPPTPPTPPTRGPYAGSSGWAYST
jgi:hypothetical protein